MGNLFGLDIAGIVNSALKGNLRPLTLRKFASDAIDEYGQPIKTYADHAGEGARSKWKTETLAARGYNPTTVKIVMLQNGIAEPLKGDEITLDGERFLVLDKERDPADATWNIYGEAI